MAASIFRYESEKSYWDPAKKVFYPFPTLDAKPELSLTVVIPAMNEEERLPHMMKDCLGYLKKRSRTDSSFTWEVIIVDDGSSDSTAQLGHSYSKEESVHSVRVLKLEKNRGKGGAVRLGALCARGKTILMADADGATTFEDYSKLEKRLKQEGVEIAVGSRAHLEEESIAKRSLFRTFLMKGFHLLVWLLAVRTVRDTQCGFKLFSREAAQSLFPNLHVERWAFDVELLYLAERFGFGIAEEAVRWREVHFKL